MEGIEIIDFQPEGYKPLVDYESWRVAVLKFCDDLLIENVKTMQKHLYTDEVFVLVQGHCTLFLAGEGDKPGKITAVHMEPHKIYNIKKGTWHNHIMDTDGEDRRKPRHLRRQLPNPATRQESAGRIGKRGKVITSV